MRWSAISAAALVALACAPDVRADQRTRVLLVAPPPGLAEATTAALSSWTLEVVTVATEAPGATMPAAAERARAIAEENGGAGAVVWIAGDRSGAALWMYDTANENVTARQLPQAPPYDEPTAAAVALTVKTLLRYSEVVPASERFGAEAAAASSAPVTVTAPAPAPRDAAVLWLDTAAGLRLRRTGARDTEPRFGVGVQVAPPALAGRGAAWARLRAGPGVPIDAADFIGHYADLTLGAGLLARIPAWPRIGLAVVPLLGASLHLTSIDGSIVSQATRAEDSRLNPSLDGGIAIELEVGQWVRLSVSGELSYATRRQEYLVAGDAVLTLPAFEGEIGVTATLPLL